MRAGSALGLLTCVWLAATGGVMWDLGDELKGQLFDFSGIYRAYALWAWGAAVLLGLLCVACLLARWRALVLTTAVLFLALGACWVPSLHRPSPWPVATVLVCAATGGLLLRALVVRASASPVSDGAAPGG